MKTESLNTRSVFTLKSVTLTKSFTMSDLLRLCLSMTLPAIVMLFTFMFVRVEVANAQANQIGQTSTLGANHFDLLMQYTGFASNANGTRAAQAVTRAMALKTIKDASGYSMKFLRVAISGYGPNTFVNPASAPGTYNLYLWQTNPTAYWSIVDQMFTDLDANGVQIVAVMMFNWTQFPSLSNETVADLIKNPHSASRNLQMKYLYQFINRYKNRNTILFYELGNELNLGADVDSVKGCLNSMPGYPEQCETTGNYTSGDLLKYSTDMVQFVKSLDARHAISSGFSLPRASAFHLAAQPQFSPTGADWTTDSPGQFASFLNTMNAPFDIISVHIYAGDVRFGRPAGTEWQTLDDVVSAASISGKQVYVGEFADNVNNGVSSFVTSFMQRIGQDHIAYASVWALEFYQFATYISSNTNNPDPNSLEPGVTDALLTKYKQISRNFALGNAGNVTSAATTAVKNPQIVITSPWPCTPETKSFTAYAVASAADGIARVDFFSNGVKVASSTQVPFSAVIPLTSTGLIVLSATAYSTSGLSSTYRTPVRMGNSAAQCVVTQ